MRGGRRRLLLVATAAASVVGGLTATSVGLAAGSQPGVAASARHAGTAAQGGAAGRAGTSVTSSSSDERSRDDEQRAPVRPAVVSTGRTAAGSVLVGDGGLTLYQFSADRHGSSSCYGACARTWLPFRSHGGKPQGDALQGVSVGSILRKDGSYQVTLDGDPLYVYAGDRKPGDAKGSGLVEFGGTWLPAHLDEKP